MESVYINEIMPRYNSLARAALHYSLRLSAFGTASV